MKSIILALSLRATMPAMAQIHYCVVNGKKALTDKPCPGQGTEIRPSTINIVQAHPIPENKAPTEVMGSTKAAAAPSLETVTPASRPSAMQACSLRSLVLAHG